MNEFKLRKRYFHWLVDLIDNGTATAYSELLRYLFDRPFMYTIPNDANREEDGIDLRYRFGRRNGIPDAEICSELDDRPCGYLEMMVALCLRVEEQIIGDPEIQNGVSDFFWRMIDSLGLSGQSNYRFDSMLTSRAIEHLENHEYASDGNGGLFYIPSCREDLRRTEIWTQMSLYLGYLYEDSIKSFLSEDQY